MGGPRATEKQATGKPIGHTGEWQMFLLALYLDRREISSIVSQYGFRLQMQAVVIQLSNRIWR